MAKQDEYSGVNKWAIAAGILGVLFVISLVSACYIAATPVDYTGYVTVESYDALNDKYNEMTVKVDELTLAVEELNGTVTDVSEENDKLNDKYAESEREDTVLELAKAAVEKDYLEDLELDAEEYDDFDFSIAWVHSSLDEDDGDYEVELDFLIMQYDEDGNVVEITQANATMTVRDDDVVKYLKINLFEPEVPVEE